MYKDLDISGFGRQSVCLTLNVRHLSRQLSYNGVKQLVLLTHALTLYIYDIILYIIIFEMKRTSNIYFFFAQRHVRSLK